MLLALLQMTKKGRLALAVKLAHQFPSSPAAPVALATALHCQQLSSGEAPSTHQERSLIIEVRLTSAGILILCESWYKQVI